MAVTATLVSALITWLVASLVVFFASKLLVKRSGLVRAFVAVLVASVLALVVTLGTDSLGWPSWIGRVLVLAAFALGLSVVYRESWLRGALLGFVAWLLWLLVSWLIGLIP